MTEKLEVYTDGASRGNPGDAALAYVILRNGNVIAEHGEAIGRATNNQAEYRALIAALERALALGADTLDLYSDSELMIRQLTGRYNVRAKGLVSLFERANSLKNQFSRVNFHAVPRTSPYIRRADSLANAALDGEEHHLDCDMPQGAEVIPIGIVRSPYKTRNDAPRQGKNDPVMSTIEVFPEYEPGLAGISEYNRIVILSWFDQSRRDLLWVDKPGRGFSRGVFATRSPDRPNPIGLTTVDLVGQKGRILHVRGLDALDGTPVLDIKPLVSDTDWDTEGA